MDVRESVRGFGYGIAFSEALDEVAESLPEGWRFINLSHYSSGTWNSLAIGPEIGKVVCDQGMEHNKQRASCGATGDTGVNALINLAEKLKTIDA